MIHKLNIGIVGGSANPQSWAIHSHIPAILESPYCELIAVSTSNMESAKKAQQLFKTKYAYDNYEELIHNIEIDLVIVSVKVGEHYPILKEALLQNKHVYSEWPLTTTIEQALELTELAKEKQLHHFIGLQARQSQVIYDAQEFIKTKLGPIISVHMNVFTLGKGKTATNRTEYQYRKDSGATLLDINGGHSIDLLQFLLGTITKTKVISLNNFNTITNIENQTTFKQVVPDSWEIIGTIEKTTPFHISLRAGVKSQFQLTIEGENGRLILSQKDSVGHPQFGKLCIKKEGFDTFSQDTITESPLEMISDYFIKIYHLIFNDITTNSYSLPNFETAYQLQSILEDIKKEGLPFN
jgi:Predicted dehydrogenases and related proteins